MNRKAVLIGTVEDWATEINPTGLMLLCTVDRNDGDESGKVKTDDLNRVTDNGIMDTV